MKFKVYNDEIRELKFEDEDGDKLTLESFRSMPLGWPLIIRAEQPVGLTRKQAVKLAKAILAEFGAD